MAHILVVDDNRTTAETLCALVNRWNFTSTVAFDGMQALAVLEEETVDLLVTDLRMPNLDGMELLRMVRSRWPEVIVIVVSAFGSIETAVEAMKLGAFDFLTKPYDDKELRVKFERAAAQRELVMELERMNARIASFEDESNPLGMGEIVGTSQAISQVFADIRKVAPTDSTVLIHGESGTGKELVARAIHKESPRSGDAFIAANCAAYAEGVLESELFGHEKGAFTGAVSRKLGRLELADKGTLFLDEVGEIPPDIQVKLLRVLQEREFERVGGTKTLRLDSRIIAATNRDLAAAVKEGRIREDLYYRLNVISIPLPPLRARMEDVPALVETFCRFQSARLKRQISGLSQRAMEIIMGYDWPGNIRELQNVIERAAILSETDEIGDDALPVSLDSGRQTNPSMPDGEVDFDREMDDYERRLILHAFEKSDRVKARTAKMLGIDRNRLRYKLKKYGIDD